VAALHPTAFEDITYAIELLDPHASFDLDAPDVQLVDKWKQKFKAVLARPTEGTAAVIFRRLTSESILASTGKNVVSIITLPTPLALQKRMRFYFQHLHAVTRVNLAVHEHLYRDILTAEPASI
jgi:hypothetical protein